MISNRTTTNFSDDQVAKLEAEAKRRGIKTPTTPGILNALIADLPEAEKDEKDKLSRQRSWREEDENLTS